jgi:hypothetical protein
VNVFRITNGRKLKAREFIMRMRWLRLFSHWTAWGLGLAFELSLNAGSATYLCAPLRSQAIQQTSN